MKCVVHLSQDIRDVEWRESLAKRGIVAAMHGDGKFYVGDTLKIYTSLNRDNKTYSYRYVAKSTKEDLLILGLKGCILKYEKITCIDRLEILECKLYFVEEAFETVFAIIYSIIADTAAWFKSILRK